MNYQLSADGGTGDFSSQLNFVSHFAAGLAAFYSRDNSSLDERAPCSMGESRLRQGPLVPRISVKLCTKEGAPGDFFHFNTDLPTAGYGFRPTSKTRSCRNVLSESEFEVYKEWSKLHPTTCPKCSATYEGNSVLRADLAHDSCTAEDVSWEAIDGAVTPGRLLVGKTFKQF